MLYNRSSTAARSVICVSRRFSIVRASIACRFVISIDRSISVTCRCLSFHCSRVTIHGRSIHISRANILSTADIARRCIRIIGFSDSRFIVRMLYNRSSTAARSVICVSRRFSVIDRSVIRHIAICSSIVSLTSGCMSLNHSRAVIRELSLGISRPRVLSNSAIASVSRGLSVISRSITSYTVIDSGTGCTLELCRCMGLDCIRTVIHELSFGASRASVFIDDADVGRRIRAVEFRISRTVTRSLLCRTSKFFAGSTTSGRLDGNGRIICCEIAAVGACRCSCRCRTFFGDGLVGSRLHRRPNGAFTESTSAIHNSLGLSRTAIGNAVFTSRLSNGRRYAAVSRGFRFDMSRRSCILSLRYITTLSGRSNNDCITFSSRAVATSRDFALALRLRTRSWFSGYILCLSARSDSSFTARSGRLSGQCTSIAEYRCVCLRCCSTGSASRSSIVFTNSIDICRRDIALTLCCRCSFRRGCSRGSSSIAASRNGANSLFRSSAILARRAANNRCSFRCRSNRGFSAFSFRHTTTAARCGFRRGRNSRTSALVCGSTTTADRCIALVYQRRCGILNGCVCRRAIARLCLRHVRTCTRCVARCRCSRNGYICSVNRFVCSRTICDRCARRCRCRFNRTRASGNSVRINHIHVVCARSARFRIASSRIINTIGIDCRTMCSISSICRASCSCSSSSCRSRLRCRYATASRHSVCSSTLCYGIGIHNARFRTFAVAMAAREHRCNASPERSGFRFGFIHCGHGRMCGLKSFRRHANRIADLGTSDFLFRITVSQRVVCNLAIFVGCGCISFLSGCITINHGRVTGIASNVFRGTSAFSSTLRQLSRCNNLGSFFVCQAALRVRYHVSIGSVAITDRNSQSTIRHIVTAHGHVNTGDFRTFSKLLCQLRVSICKRVLHSSQRFLRIVINSGIRVAHFCSTLLVGHLEPTGIVSFGSIKLLLCFSLFGISGNSSRLFLVVFAKRRIGNTSKVIQILAFHCRPCGNCSRTICAILVQLTSGDAERCGVLCIRNNVAKTSPLPVRHASSGPFLRAICRSASGIFKTKLAFICSKDCTLPIRTDSQVGSLGCNRARFITRITESGNACNFAILIAVSDLTIDSAFNGVIGSQVFNRTLRHLATIKPKLIQSVCHGLTIRIGIKGFTRVIIHVATLSVCTTYKAVGLFFVTKADLAVFVQIACSPSRCAICTCSCCHVCSNWLAITARAAYNISNGISSCTAVASNATCQIKNIMRSTRNNSESASRFTHRVKTRCACDTESGSCKHIVQLLCDFEVCVCDKAPFHDAFNRCADQSDVQCRSRNTNDPNVQNQQNTL